MVNDKLEPTPSSINPSDYVDWVRGLTKRYMNRLGVPIEHFDELVGEALLGLVEAAERYDSSAGIKFKSYAVTRVQGAVLDGLSKVSGLSRSAYKKLKAYKALAEYQHHEEMPLLRKATGADKLAVVFDLAARATLVYQVNLISDSGEEVCTSIDNSPDVYLENRQQSEKIRGLIKELPEKEGLILRQYYFEQLTFEQIGEMHGMTKGGICKIHKKALDKLKAHLSTTEDYNV